MRHRFRAPTHVGGEIEAKGGATLRIQLRQSYTPLCESRRLLHA